MLRICSRCGKLHTIGYVCTVGKHRRFSDTEENKLRSNASWKKKRESIRERSFYLCAVCKEQGIYTPKDIEVHHIVKIKDAPNLYLDDANLIALCIEHHKDADKGRIDPDYLRELARKRDEQDNEMKNPDTPPVG